VKRGEPLRRGVPLRAAPAVTAAWRGRGKRLQPRSAKKAAAQPEEEWVRAVVFARDQGCLLSHLPNEAGRCAGPLTFHHLRKAGQGGPYTVANGVALCAGHNGWVEDYPLEALRWGLVVRGSVTVTEAAARRATWGLTPRRHRWSSRPTLGT
jgi:hypothetical protein